jgi:hypothetical protein
MWKSAANLNRAAGAEKNLLLASMVHCELSGASHQLHQQRHSYALSSSVPVTITGYRGGRFRTDADQQNLPFVYV